MTKVKMPVVGEFVSQAGRKVVVHAATLSQSLAFQTAAEEGNAASLGGIARFVGECAEVEGADVPADALTSADCMQVVKLATGGGDADFR